VWSADFHLPDFLDQFVPILFGHPEVADQYIVSLALGYYRLRHLTSIRVVVDDEHAHTVKSGRTFDA
jgi:hypothetical protein